MLNIKNGGIMQVIITKYRRKGADEMKLKINIKEIRSSKNITLEELSKKADVDLKELEKFENGNINIKFNTAIKIAYALEVKVSDLYKIEEY